MFNRRRNKSQTWKRWSIRLGLGVLAVGIGTFYPPVKESQAALATIDIQNLSEARRQLSAARDMVTEARKQVTALGQLQTQIGSAMSYVGRIANDPKRLRNEVMACMPASPIGGTGPGVTLPSLCDAVELVSVQLDIPAGGGAATNDALNRRGLLREAAAKESVATALHAKEDIKRTQTEYETLAADAASPSADLATQLGIQNRILLKMLDEQIKSRALLAQLVAQQGSQGLAQAPAGKPLRPNGPVTGLGSRGE